MPKADIFREKSMEMRFERREGGWQAKGEVSQTYTVELGLEFIDHQRESY